MKKIYGLILLLFFITGTINVSAYNKEHTADLKGNPDKFILNQNYPNPFNPETKISFSLPKPANITIKVYDIMGGEVATLINNEKKSAGSHQISFDAVNLPSGIYFYRLLSDNFSESKKMILIK